MYTIKKRSATDSRSEKLVAAVAIERPRGRKREHGIHGVCVRGRKMVDGKIETEEEEEEEQGEKLEGRGGAENEGKEKKKKGERRGGMLLT